MIYTRTHYCDIRFRARDIESRKSIGIDSSVHLYIIIIVLSHKLIYIASRRSIIIIFEGIKRKKERIRCTREPFGSSTLLMMRRAL